MNMVRTWRRRAAVLTATVVAAGTLPLLGVGTAAAAPSNVAEPATSGDCLYILNTNGYRTTPARASACSDVEEWLVLFCRIALENTGVNSYVARLACNAAADD
ncbi:hypothetical protein [Streptomyces sp. GESEQ-4]|uniref:hypothetical protein n=1 Tax=Streptomyces sp. GESEQ-4 TaxID=2812655 RepID=UPI001B331895|nr:hypothetical protein [Streptomyces sp. GESEQ-4]